MNRPLVALKILHTLVWILMVTAIICIPASALCRQYKWSASLSLVVWGECAVLLLNRGRCPMSDWARHYAPENSANFDIYLPEWLARHNKTIFGTVFLLGELISVVLWKSQN